MNVNSIKAAHEGIKSIVADFVEDIELNLELEGRLKSETVKEKKGKKKEESSKFSFFKRLTTFASTIDPKDNDFFEIEDVSHGDEFGCVMPFKASVKEPLNHNPINPKAPE